MKINNKIYTILITFAIGSLFLVVLFVWPLLKEIKKNSKDLVSAKNNIVTLVAQTIETEKFKNDYKTYEPNLEKIDRLFVDPSNPVDFIKFLETAAYEYQVTSQISLQASSQASRRDIVFQFSSKGGFSQMLNFLKEIENGPYLVEVENLTIQNSQDQAASQKSALADIFSRKVDAVFIIKAFIKPN